jgi:NAD(P)-dependent dehydrogenase (short-subunit alcohol dehydrogenase family)
MSRNWNLPPFGGIDVLMNDAGVQPGSGCLDLPRTGRNVVGINLWRVFHGTQVFVPDMIERGRPGLIIYPECPTSGNEPLRNCLRECYAISDREHFE